MKYSLEQYLRMSWLGMETMSNGRRANNGCYRCKFGIINGDKQCESNWAKNRTRYESGQGCPIFVNNQADADKVKFPEDLDDDTETEPDFLNEDDDDFDEHGNKEEQQPILISAEVEQKI